MSGAGDPPVRNEGRRGSLGSILTRGVAITVFPRRARSERSRVSTESGAVQSNPKLAQRRCLWHIP